MHISSSFSPTSSDNFEKAAARLAERRASGRAWRKNRDVNLLATERRAEQAALPSRKQPADRLCLECGAVFKSQWCGNRRCKLCTERNP
jgi:hypothetical protein